MGMNRSGGLYVGELAPIDGSAVLVEALSLFPGARIQALPSGEAHAAQRARAMERSAYLVVAPHDGDLQRTLAEAFAQGLAVIAPHEGACAELVEPGRNGLHYEPGSPRDLARRLAWAEAFPERMLQMGECARADYLARFISHWSYPKLFGERRRSARV
ncbi:MAG TPA: glycosyltransferase [Burkholderiales bacterium]